MFFLKWYWHLQKPKYKSKSTSRSYYPTLYYPKNGNDDYDYNYDNNYNYPAENIVENLYPTLYYPAAENTGQSTGQSTGLPVKDIEYDYGNYNYNDYSNNQCNYNYDYTNENIETPAAAETSILSKIMTGLPQFIFGAQSRQSILFNSILTNNDFVS